MIFSIVDKIIFAAFAFFTNILIAKIVTPYQYGFYVYIQAIIYILIQISGLGIKNIFIKEYINNTERQYLKSTTFLLKFIMVFFALFIFLFMFYWTSNNDYLYLAVFALPCFLYSFDQYEWENEIKNKFKLIMFIRVSVLFIFFLIKVWILFSNANINMLIFIYSLEIPSCYLVQYFFGCYIAKNSELIRLKVSVTKAITLLKQSWPIFIGLILASIYNRIDQIMLGSMVNKEELALYGLSVKFTEPFNIFVTGMISYIYPKLLKLKSISGNYELEASKWFYIVLLSGVFISMSLYFIGYNILLLFDDVYSNSDEVFRVLALNIPFMFIGVYLSNNLLIHGLQRLLIVRSLIGVITNVILNLLFIPEYGGLGAAVATLITMLTINVMFYLITKNTRAITLGLYFDYFRR